jgi:hypothetical protein
MLPGYMRKALPIVVVLAVVFVYWFSKPPEGYSYTSRMYKVGRLCLMLLTDDKGNGARPFFTSDEMLCGGKTFYVP